MTYIRSRKFCCCLPVRFGVFCGSLIGLALGGLAAIGSYLSLSDEAKGKLVLSHSEHISLWVLGVTMTIFALTSLMGLVGSVGRLRPLVGIYAGTITFVTVLDVAAGIFFIYNLFATADEQIDKCEADAKAAGNTSGDVTHFACSAGFKTGRVIVVIVYVLFWLFEIYGCVIAFEYLGQLNEDKEAEVVDAERKGMKPMTIVNNQTQQYPFAAAPNAYGQ